MSVLQFVQHRIGKKLELRFLHDEHHLLLQLFRCLRSAIQQDRAAGRLVQTCQELSGRRFAAAVRPDQPHDLMPAGSEAHPREQRRRLLPCPFCPAACSVSKPQVLCRKHHRLLCLLALCFRFRGAHRFRHDDLPQVERAQG